MKASLILIASLAGALPAAAHTGHIADVAGHDHWVAGIAIGAAIAVGIWGALKGGRSKDDEAETDEVSDELPDGQEA